MPLILEHKVADLAALAGHSEFAEILIVFKRVLNILKQGAERYPDEAHPWPDAAALDHPASLALLAATEAVEGQIAEAAVAMDFGRALERMLTLQQPLEDFFNGPMVLDEDPAKRAARLGLMARLAHSFRQVADFSRISTR